MAATTQTVEWKVKMKISKEWTPPNKETFNLRPINDFIHRNLRDEIKLNAIIIDPFSNGKRLTDNSIINDLNPYVESDYHLDALDFMKIFKDNSVDAVLYDPPYSPRQVSECYKVYGRTVTQEMTS